jgi:hypothetical protein
MDVNMRKTGDKSAFEAMGITFCREEPVTVAEDLASRLGSMLVAAHDPESCTQEVGGLVDLIG